MVRASPRNRSAKPGPRAARQQDLHRDRPAEHVVVGAPHVAHAADWRSARPAGSGRRAACRWASDPPHRRLPSPSTACMTSFGDRRGRLAAVASLPESPPFSRSTATATCGSFCQREADEPAVRRRASPFCAVPVLPPTSNAGDLRRSCRCRSSTTLIIIWRQLAGHLRRSPRLDSSSGSVVVAARVRSGALQLVDQVRAHLLAVVGDRAAIIAPCSGVSATSRCPIAGLGQRRRSSGDLAEPMLADDAAAGRRSGVAVDAERARAWSQPLVSAELHAELGERGVAETASAPRCRVICRAPHDSPPEFGIGRWSPAACSVAPGSTRVRASRPFSSAAAATITLNVEPGG